MIINNFIILEKNFYSISKPNSNNILLLGKKRNLNTNTINIIVDNYTLAKKRKESEEIINNQISFPNKNIFQKTNEKHINYNNFQHLDKNYFSYIKEIILNCYRYYINLENKKNNNIDIYEKKIINNSFLIKKNKYQLINEYINDNNNKKLINNDELSIGGKNQQNKFKNYDIMNNEIKVINYNKSVYMNKLLIKKNNNRIKKSKRSSKYRGVSKNGKKWQVLFMINKNKNYIGTYSSEEIAARVYDIISIKKKGIKSKTNFLYNNQQIIKILEKDIDFKSENISNIIYELIANN